MRENVCAIKLLNPRVPITGNDPPLRILCPSIATISLSDLSEGISHKALFPGQL